MVRVELPEVTTLERGTLVGLRDAARPTGEPSVRLMVPVKPSKPFSAMVEVPDKPASIERADGLGEMLKSTMLTVMSRLCETGPLVPTMVTT